MRVPRPTDQTARTLNAPEASCDHQASCDREDPRAIDASRRRLGILGTVARGALGAWMVWSVVFGHWMGVFRPLPWVLGLLVFPGAMFLWHWRKVRGGTGPIAKTGLIARATHPSLLAIMYFLPGLLPELWFTADAALLFYGSAMMLGAARGQQGCEVLALSNWVLRRDDSVGCLLFAPADALDRRPVPDQP